MAFKLNIKFVATDFINPLMRNEKLLSLLYSFLYPFEVVYSLLNNFITNDILFYYQYTNQVISMEKLLCDLYDPDQRRITITDGTIEDTFLIHNKAEGFTPVYLHNSGENFPVVYLKNNAEISLEIDFVVNIPSELDTYITKERIVAMVNKYKLYEKTFTLNIL